MLKRAAEEKTRDFDDFSELSTFNEICFVTEFFCYNGVCGMCNDLLHSSFGAGLNSNAFRY